MAFTVTTPELIDDIRFYLGNLPETIISNTDMTRIIDLITTSHPEYTNCDMLYYSTVETLRFLVRVSERGSAGTGGTTGSGDLKKFTEKVGQMTITKEYDVGSTSGSTGKEAGWDRLLTDLLDNPSLIGCPITQDNTTTAGSKYGAVHIGGVSQGEYERVKNNSDSRSGWDTRSPFRETLSDKWR